MYLLFSLSKEITILVLQTIKKKLFGVKFSDGTKHPLKSFCLLFSIKGVSLLKKLQIILFPNYADLNFDSVPYWNPTI